MTVTATTTPRDIVPATRLTAIGLGGCWTALAAAETVIGDLDALGSVATIADGSARVIGAGLLHTLSGLLLVIGLVGSVELAWQTRTGRIGWSLSSLTAACLGSFGMLHLLAVETAASGLDAAAMDEFLVDRLGGFGAWSVPIVFVALLGPWSLALLLLGLTRAQQVQRSGPLVFALGALGHLLGLGPSWLEWATHWAMAAGAVLTVVHLARGLQVRPGTINPDS